MPSDSQLRVLGKLLLASLGLLLLSSCRDSVPPKIEICIGDGAGGADCVESDGSQMHRTPSQLTNYWMTSEPDEANLLSWCYMSETSLIMHGMDKIEEKAQQ